MADAITKLADAVKPDLFAPYMIKESAEKWALLESGAVGTVDYISVPESGKILTAPFWNDITQDDSQQLDDTTGLETKKLTSGTFVANILGRGQAWSANALTADLAGSNPMDAIAGRVSTYWAKDMQKTLINVLDGVLGATGAAAILENDISAGIGAASNIDDDAILDTFALMGDSGDKPAVIVMHSAVFFYLHKAQLIDTTVTPEGRPDINFYRGMRVIVDDGLAPAAGVYDTYLLKPNAVGFAEANMGARSVEVDRDVAADVDKLYTRRRFMMHPTGFSWNSTGIAAVGATEQGPTNAELATGANWDLVETDGRKHGIFRLKHKINQS